jgi:phosphatidylserine decarboxylase
MRLHKEGFKVLGWFVPLSLGIIFLFTWLYPVMSIFHLVFFLFLTLLNMWAVSFFRVPSRTVNLGLNHVLSSADGKVVAIEEVIENEFFKEKRIQVSVFMSPLNVHVNWYPFDGKVAYAKYHPGKFLVAYHPKSSELNERTSIVVERADGKAVMIRQIAGMMARRIVYNAKLGAEVKQGEEFGIIRFGSRVDFFLPLDARIDVKLGEKVRGQQTVIATL